jgi:hypothetical protein
MTRERVEQLWLVVILGIIALPTGVLFVLSAFPDVRVHAAHVGLKALADVADWFDPMFFQYNLLLLLGAQAVVPCVTFMYVVRMRREKLRRLANEVPPALWHAHEASIRARVEQHFRFANYLPSALLALVVVALGISIILLLKPTSGGVPGSGVDYAKGGNILLLGPVIQYAADSPVFYHRLVTSLIAFQFGFLGAYIYFIAHLVRSYFTLDLTPHTFVESTIRMVTASVLALIISFVLPLSSRCASATPPYECITHALPLAAFFLGYFPDRALLLIDKLGTRLVRALPAVAYRSTPLSDLHGVSFAHEIRLNREGFDNIENLVQADPLELAVRTGFGYQELSHWIDQGWLRIHLGEEYDTFAKATGITDRSELRDFLQRWEGKDDTGVERLTGWPGAPAVKIAVLATLA